MLAVPQSVANGLNQTDAGGCCLEPTFSQTHLNGMHANELPLPLAI
jgi:hypothetical protein